MALIDRHYIRWMNSTGKNHPLYGYGKEYEKARFDNNTDEKIILERAEQDKKKLECIKQDVDQWLEKQHVTVEEILAILMKKIARMKCEDERQRGYWEDPYRIYRKDTVKGLFACEFLKRYEI